MSAHYNPKAVYTVINKEIEWGHTSGPFRSPPITPLHFSPHHSISILP